MVFSSWIPKSTIVIIAIIGSYSAMLRYIHHPLSMDFISRST